MTTRNDKPGIRRNPTAEHAARGTMAARTERSAPSQSMTLNAIAAAVMALGAGQALANGFCPSYTIANGDIELSTCVLGAGSALDVQVGGVIAPTGTGVLIPLGTTAGSITNAGTISSGTLDAISVLGSISGGITNSGTIYGAGTGRFGIAVSSGTVSGGITNSGSIGGHTSGIRIDTGSVVDRITNSGSISGIFALHVDAGTVAGGITNSGTIVGSQIGIRLSGNTTMTGDIVNSGSIGGGSSGIALETSTLSGSIVNTGTLTGLYGGIAIGSSTMSGGITNSGMIGGGSSDERGMFVYASTISGGITNSGTIRGGSSGGVAVKIEGSAITGGIANSGTISGGPTAISIDSSTIAGGITNSGAIIASSSGAQAFYVNVSAITGGITNSGAIIASSSGGQAMSIGFSTITGGITNSGRISGGGSSGTGIALSSSTITGDIRNSGTITGGSSSGIGNGVSLVSATIIGAIRNSGTIAGGGSSGIGIRIFGSTVTGGISNSGRIFGPGTGFFLDSSSTVTGGITNAGTISAQGTAMYVAGNSSIAGGITNSGSIGGNTGGIFMIASTITGGITNSGTISGYAGAISINGNSSIDGGITNTGVIRGGSSSGNGINLSSSTISGSISNSGSISGGSNGIRIDSSTITGGITNSGTISAPGSVISVDAGSWVPVIHNRAGGMIDGTLSILSTATNVTNAGTIAIPAGATSSIAGNYTQQGTGVLRTRVLDDSTYGSLSVSGVATLPSNAKIDVDVANPSHPFTVTGMADVIRAGTLVSDGTFAVTDNSALFNFTAVKDGNTVDLVLTAAGASGVHDAVVANRNTPANGASLALDQIIQNNPGGPLAQLFVGLTNQPQVNGAATQVLPLLTGGSLQAGGAAYSGINQTIQARIGNNQGMPSGDMFLGDRNFWLKPFGSWADQGDRQGVSGYKANVTGVATGFDGTLHKDLRVGAAFAYANAGVDGKSSVAPHRLDADIYQFIGYGSYNLDANTFVNFQGDVGINRNRGARTITFAPSVAYSSFDSVSLHAGISLARRYAKSADTSFIPSVRLDYTTVKEDAYSETGAGALNLSVEGRRVDQLIAGADARVVHTLGDRTTLSANAGLGYDFFAERNAINASFAGAPGVAFTTYGADPRPWVVRGGAGLTYRMPTGMELTVRYDLEQRAEYLNQTASARLRWLF